MKKIYKWIRENYNTITGSIAFYPAIIAVGFLLLSWLMLEVDFSDWGKHFKQQLPWLSLKDASTARSIVSTVASGILSVAVFSFSLVMIVLNQAASQMSNRVLSSMIENRFQQIILGFYIGTIVYALFLLSTIRDIHSGIYVPALSIYLLILLTMSDIFLFIYFLDYVTQSVKYSNIIHRVQTETLDAMKNKFERGAVETAESFSGDFITVRIPESGYFQDFDQSQVLNMVKEHNFRISLLHPRGTYLIAGSPFLELYGTKEADRDTVGNLLLGFDFFNGEPIRISPEYGFRQLTEVAIRALSPGINDPATAVLCLHALGDLLAFRMHYVPNNVIKDEMDVKRLIVKTISFEELIIQCIDPIWQYGKDDLLVQDAFKHVFSLLSTLDTEQLYAFAMRKYQRI